MTLRIMPMPETEVPQSPGDGGLGALSTERGNLPLEGIDADVRITGLVSHIELTQSFRNPHDVPLEATYIFPLPDRAAVTAMRLTAADRTVHAELREREQARQQYDEAIAAGQRAAIAEEERPDVFTMRVGNILPGERVSVSLTLVGPLAYEDGEATFRLPLVVAPRYIPGTPVEGAVGDGWAPDTDAVPDASRITPPVLLPGFPNPVKLSINVDVDPGGLPLGAVRSSLHAVQTEGRNLSINPGERVNRDFILRLAYGQPDASAQAVTLTPDATGDEGTLRLVILPPTSAAPPRPRDLVLVLDRSGSMMGWKMVAARRAAARIIDTLTAADRFSVIAFDDRIEHSDRLGAGLNEGSDRNRFAAVEFLSRMDARGGTELLAPLRQARDLLTDAGRDRIVVLVTDGQVGNEDQILQLSFGDLRVHTVGIDQAVNAGFLGRLAAAGGGRCELVESEDRLDEAMDHIHRRIGAPVVTGLKLAIDGVELVPDTLTPSRLPDLFPGAPLVVTGRYRSARAEPVATVTGKTRPGDAWSATLPAATVPDETLTAVWARAHLRDLEDRYASRPYGRDDGGLEKRIVATSLRFGVLCRFTAWVAIDERVVTEGGKPHRVTQPVELPAGWQPPGVVPMPAAAPIARTFMAAPMAGGYAATGMPSPARPAPPKAKSGGILDRLRKSNREDSAAMDAELPLGPPPGVQLEAAPSPALEREESPVDPAVSATAAQEARRLREATGAPEYEKRELLADLGTRLQALARELGASPQAQTVRALLVELTEDRLSGLGGASLVALWDRVLAVLDELASPSEDSGGSGARPAFWKRA